MQPPSKPSPHTPELWRTDAGGDSVAVLDIPGLNGRARVFDVDATLLVNVPAGADGAWLELTVEFDGKRQWNRRIPAHNPGQTDGLDYHQRLRLEAEIGGYEAHAEARDRVAGVYASVGALVNAPIERVALVESATVAWDRGLQAIAFSDPLEPGERFDLITSNPPYIESSVIAGLMPEVRECHDVMRARKLAMKNAS